MLKVQNNDIRRFMKKFDIVIFIFAIGIINMMFIASLPGIFIFIFFLFKKFILKSKNMKEYDLLDILVTSLLYGFIFCLGTVFIYLYMGWI